MHVVPALLDKPQIAGPTEIVQHEAGRSAGPALAIRHLVLAVPAIANLIQSIAFRWMRGQVENPNVVVTGTWFPVFARFAAAPLFLYDRTAASESGPLLQLDRTSDGLALGVREVRWQVAGPPIGPS